MAIENPVFLKLQTAITPIISIGVGSAICTVCTRLNLDPIKLEDKDIVTLKVALVDHYKKFWAKQIADIEAALGKVA